MINKPIVEKVIKTPVNLIAQSSEKPKTPRVRTAKPKVANMQPMSAVVETSIAESITPSNINMKIEEESSNQKSAKKLTKRREKKVETSLDGNLSGTPVKRVRKPKDPSIITPKKLPAPILRMEQEDKPSLISQVSTDANSKYDYLQAQPSRIETKEHSPLFEQKPIETQQFFPTPNCESADMQGGNYYNNNLESASSNHSHYNSAPVQNNYTPAPMSYPCQQDPRKLLQMFYRPFCVQQQQQQQKITEQQQYAEPQMPSQNPQAYYAQIEPRKTINNTFVLQIPMIQNSPQFVQVLQNSGSQMASMGNGTQYFFVPNQMNQPVGQNITMQGQYQAMRSKIPNILRPPYVSNENRYGMPEQQANHNYPYAHNAASYIQNEPVQQNINNNSMYRQPLQQPQRIPNMNTQNQQYLSNGMYFQQKNSRSYYMNHPMTPEQTNSSYQGQDTASYGIQKGQGDYTQNNEMGINPQQSEAVQYQNGGYRAPVDNFIDYSVPAPQYSNINSMMNTNTIS